MLQNPCKTLGFKKNMVYKIPPGGGGVNHIQPVAYNKCHRNTSYTLSKGSGRDKLAMSCIYSFSYLVENKCGSRGGGGGRGSGPPWKITRYMGFYRE